LGEKLGILSRPGDVFCVSGELGAGKTILAKGVASGLGVGDTVTSPTFTLINEYKGRLVFYHMDVYRLESPGDMTDLGYEEYFYGSGVTMVEWAEKVRELLPRERLDIVMEYGPGGEEERKIIFKPRGKRFRLLLKEMLNLVRAGD